MDAELEARLKSSDAFIEARGASVSRIAFQHIKNASQI